MDRNIFAWIHVDKKKFEIAWSKLHSKRLLINDRSPTIIQKANLYNSSTTRCHFSQCCTRCVHVRPSKNKTSCISYVCVYFRENKNQHQISSHVCTTHCDLWWRPAKSWEKICYGQKNKQSDKKHTSEGKTCKERWTPCKFRPFRRKTHENQHGKKSPEAISNSPGSEREVVKLLFKKLSKNRDKLLGVANSNDNTKENRRKPIHTDVARGVITIIKQYFCRQKYDQRWCGAFRCQLLHGTPLCLFVNFKKIQQHSHLN